MCESLLPSIDRKRAAHNDCAYRVHTSSVWQAPSGSLYTWPRSPTTSASPFIVLGKALPIYTQVSSLPLRPTCLEVTNIRSRMNECKSLARNRTIHRTVGDASSPDNQPRRDGRRWGAFPPSV